MSKVIDDARFEKYDGAWSELRMKKNFSGYLSCTRSLTDKIISISNYGLPENSSLGIHLHEDDYDIRWYNFHVFDALDFDFSMEYNAQGESEFSIFFALYLTPFMKLIRSNDNNILDIRVTYYVIL